MKKKEKEFCNWITTPIPNIHKYTSMFNIRDTEENTKVEGQNFIDHDLSLKSIDCVDFVDCCFNNCKLDSTWFSYIYFDNVIFENCKIQYTKFTTCEFRKCKFNNCSIVGLEIASCDSFETLFTSCKEILDLNIRAGRRNVYKFSRSFIAFLNIESYFFETELNCKLQFNYCQIKKSNFKHLDLLNSVFKKCIISLNSFALCKLSKNTLEINNTIEEKEYNVIDFRTILNSEIQNGAVLSELFGIHQENVQDYVLDLTSKVEFHSTFISYSYLDEKIAKRINGDLMKRGIPTFLWEKDAPSGKSTKQIMVDKVNSHDKVLFISSANSLKSDSCQFELSEARKKTSKNWSVSLFPIDIDKFLFQVSKHQIPLQKQEEYWLNIEELRNVNSIDATKCFDQNKNATKTYSMVLKKLIDDLRK